MHINPARVEDEFGGIDQFGRVLFSYGLVPFELSSALLMVAVLGAVAVAKGKDSNAQKFREVVRARSLARAAHTQPSHAAPAADGEVKAT
jgi:hypothetical protein